MKLRRLLLLTALALPLPLSLAHAQSETHLEWQQQPVPYYSTAHFLHGLYRNFYLPFSAEFALHARGLPKTLQALCSAPADKASEALDNAREAWRDTMIHWEALSAVAVGPLIERRSLRQIDTAPARPQLIERAIKTQPQGAKAFERVGTPAKGLPALEWLLWGKPVQPGTPACSYAVEVALDVQREADALAAAFKQRAATDWEDEAMHEEASAAMTEFINQWIGGIERLRWANMEKPLRAAETGNLVPAWPVAAKNWPRAASRNTFASWDNTRSILHISSVLSPADRLMPTPGQEHVPVESYLRGRGLNPLADKLVQTTSTIESAFVALDAALKKSSKNTGTKVMEATRALAALKRLAEGERIGTLVI